MDWKDFFAQTSEGAKGLCIGSLSSYTKSVTKDVQKFLEKSKSNFLLWSQQVLDGTLSKEEYESLVKRQMAGIEFIAIKKAGIGKIELEKFSSGLVKIIIDTTFSLLPFTHSTYLT